MRAPKPLQRKTPLRQKATLGRVPIMGRPDGAAKVVDVLARRNRTASRTRPKTTPLRKSAQGEGCTMNVASVCNYNVDTVIFAHFRWLGDCGTGIKPTDLQGAYACSECNRWTDSPTPAETADRAAYEAARNFYALRAIVRTLLRMVAKGLITVKGIAA